MNIKNNETVDKSLYSKINLPLFGIVLILALFITFYSSKALAQTGSITGEVSDFETGESLPGASITVQGTTIGTSTDVDGRYTLRRVPSGDQTVIYRYMGYVTQEITLVIEANERTEQNVELVGDMIEGDEIFVTARQRGQSRALTRQRESVNIRSVISSAQMDRFADQTVTGALQRIAGMGHGGANIRGIGAGSSTVTMDGQRMGSTGGDRSVDLETISADMVQEIDVIKVITPDMDADALSGVINISTRRPVGGERNLNTRFGGGWNSRFSQITDPNARASFSYGESPRDDFSYGVNLSYQRDTPANESIGTGWTIANFEATGAVDVFAGASSQIVIQPRERYGAGLQLTFQPSDRTTFHVQGMFNFQDNERQHYIFRLTPTTARLIDPYTTGGHGNQARITTSAGLREANTHQHTFQTSARHLFDRFDMEYALGWGHGNFVEDSYSFGFRTHANYEYSMEYDDPWHPRMDIAPHSEQTSYPGPGDFHFTGIDHRWTYHIDNEFTGTLDFDVPLSIGSLKFGSSGLMTFKSGNQERFVSDYDRTVHMDDFDMKLNEDWRIFDREHQTYHLPWLLDLHSARDWYHGLNPLFDYNLDAWASSETNNFSAHEFTFATYGMGTIDIGSFRFLGGARVEHTDTRYDGRSGSIGESGRFLGANDTSAVNNYTNIFPNAQVVYKVGNRSNVRLAYSRSIGRPNFTQLSPYTMTYYDQETISTGNPELRPMLSHNVDMLFEHYFMNVGQFTIGLYYKALRDFVYRSHEILGPGGVDGQGLYSGWDMYTNKNGEQGLAYGFEMSWQQNLSFLPGFLSYLGTYANYSYTNSEAEVSGRRDDPPPIQRQRPHVVNAGLDYSRGGFSGQISYHWGAPSIASYGNQRRVPQIDPHIRVWFDRYTDAANDVSLTLRYRLTSHFRLWADASNLFNHRSISYNYDRDYYPARAELRGRTVNMGIRYSF